MTLVDIWRLIRLVQRRQTTYEEFIKFVFGETPPPDHNFLARIKIADIKQVLRSPAYKRGRTYNSATRIAFSVIVPTFNGADRLRDTIDTLLRQQGIQPQQYEVIVMDDGSANKDSETLLRAYMEDYPEYPITYIYNPINRGPAFARNIGVKFAAGEFVCFTDDDCIVPPDWLQNFRKAFRENPEIAGVGGWYKPIKTTGNHKVGLFNRFIFWGALPSVLLVVKSSTSAGNSAGNTANICYKRSIIEKIGGFNHYFTFASHEDWELKIRLAKNRFPLLHQPRFVSHRKSNFGLSAFIRMYLIRGFSGFILYKIHPDYTSYHGTLTRSLGQSLIQIAELFSWRHRVTGMMEPEGLEFSYLFVPLNFLKHFFLCVGKYGLIIWDKPLTSRRQDRIRVKDHP